MPPRANPQAAYYASLGRSVAKTARAQKTRGREGRNVVTGARRAPVAPAARAYVSQGRAVAKAAQQQRRAVVHGLPATTTRIPKAPSLTPAQLAADRRNQYVSQGRAVEKAAKGQKRQTYTERPLAARRQIVAQAHTTAAARRTPEQRAALQVHHERHAGDVAAIGRIGMTERAAERLGAQKRAEYVSQGQAVAKAAGEQQSKTVKVGAFEVPKALTETDPAKLKAAGFAPPGIGEKLAQAPIKALANVPKNVQELAVTAPTTLAKMAVEHAGAVGKAYVQGSPKPLIKQAEKDVKETIAGYKPLVKDPIGFATENPVSTYLMLAPGAKVPGRLIGKTARRGALGKAAQAAQSLERAPATLPGTTLKAARAGSPNVLRRAAQGRADVGKRPVRATLKRAVTLAGSRERLRGAQPRAVPVERPRISTDTTRVQAGSFQVADELGKRVDEFRDLSQHIRTRHVNAAARDAAEKAKHLPKAERKAAVAERIEGAHQGVPHEISRRFAQEFGSHWQVHQPDPAKPGVIVKPKNATEGHLFDDKAHADQVATAIGKAGHFEPKVVDAGYGKFAVVPKVAADRLAEHSRVGTSPATGARILRATSKSFRGTVLPTSLKWLAGQAVEAGGRLAVAGAGPADWWRAGQVVKRMNAYEKHSGDDLLARSASGGQFGKTGVVRTWLDADSPSLGDQFEGTFLGPGARKVSAAAAKPGIRHVRRGWGHYSNFVFDKVNGIIEHHTQRALLGHHIRQGPLMEKRLIGVTDKALEEAARGLRGTHNQVEAGRAVDRMYGKYSKMPPEMREALAHNTPFLPWFVNMVHFLGKTLPHDHPVKAALLTSYSQATQDWRIKNNLSYYGGGKHEPDWMMGSYPSKKGNVQLSRYGPALPADVPGALGSLFLPQISGTAMNLYPGVDWKGKPVRGSKSANAALTAAETHVPGVARAGQLTGLSDKVRGKADIVTAFEDPSVVGQRAKGLIPFLPVASGPATGRGKGGPTIKAPTITAPTIKAPVIKAPTIKAPTIKAR